jgi:hypothetical protein
LLHDPPVLACAEPSEDETLPWPLLFDEVLESLELLLLESSLVVVEVVDEPSVEVADDVSCADCVASRAA